jgi:hypothetical protein
MLKGISVCCNEEIIITERIECFQHLEAFESNKDELAFQENLINLVRVKDLAELYGNQYNWN